jgi:hypothetical protein
MKKLILTILIVLSITSVLYAQDNQDNNELTSNGEILFGFELPGLGVGIGPIFRNAYGLLIPGMETRINLFTGVILSGEAWYGEGNIEPYSIIGEHSYSVGYVDNYLRADFIQIILGDHYTGNYWFDAGFKYEYRIRSFWFPGLSGRPDNLYEGDVIVGDEFHQRHRTTLYLEFDYSNDSISRFRKTWGFSMLGETFFEAGSEWDGNYWSYISLKTELHGWIPIIDKFMFIHLVYLRNVASESFSDTPLVYYAFPKINNGNWNPVRGFDTTIRGLASNTISIELKSRPLELEQDMFDGLGISNIISFFSFGGGLFFDAGFIRHPIDYSLNLTASDVLKYSMGVYAETKYIIVFNLLYLTLHTGVILFHNDTEDGNGVFSPKFYFAFG